VTSRDDEAAFEAAVDAEFQAACGAREAVRRRNEEQLKSPPDERTFFIFPPCPDRVRIRERLLRERREAEEEEYLKLRLERERDEAKRRIATAEPTEQEHVFREAAPPPLPNDKQLGSFTHGTLQKAVKLFGEDETTRGDVVRATSLPPPDARRVRLMRRSNLFRLNAAGKLVVDERVARRGSSYVLRYLDESGTRWLDPNRELKGR
jgi:hypothetical protein